MGRDKASVVLGGRPLLQHMLEKLRTLGLQARVAGLRAPVAGVMGEVLDDAHPDCGPLSGIETALRKSEAAFALILGVDLPLLETEFLAWMLQRAAITGAMATIARIGGEPQPLCAVYRRELLDQVTAALESGDYKVMKVMESVGSGMEAGIDFFDAERVAATGAWCSTRATHLQFMNCNTPEELAVAAAFLSGKHFP